LRAIGGTEEEIEERVWVRHSVERSADDQSMVVDASGKALISSKASEVRDLAIDPADRARLGYAGKRVDLAIF